MFYNPEVKESFAQNIKYSELKQKLCQIFLKIIWGIFLNPSSKILKSLFLTLKLLNRFKHYTKVSNVIKILNTSKFLWSSKMWFHSKFFKLLGKPHYDYVLVSDYNQFLKAKRHKSVSEIGLRWNFAYHKSEKVLPFFLSIK